MLLYRITFAFGLMLAAGSSLFSQNTRPVVFEFGAAAGVPFNAVLGAKQRLGFQQTIVEHLERPKIVAGPVIDAIVYNRVLIEFGALYRPNRFDIDRFTLGSCIDPQCTMRNRGTESVQSGHGRLWEFPLSVNFYIGQSRIRPYAGGGIVLSQDLSGTSDFRFTDPLTGAVTSVSGPLGRFRPMWPSIIADAGLEWSRSRFRLRPELRYTRHRPDQNAFETVLQLHPDQFDLLLGFSFPKR